MNAQDLKNSILQLAVQGKLVEQRPKEGTAKELLAQIKAEKERLIQDKKIKKEKPLPKITDEEKPFEIPESWEWVRVCDIFNVKSAMRIHQTDWKTEGVPFFRGRELVQLIKTGDADFDIYISQELYENNKKKGGVPQKDDILITAVGTIGKSYIVKGIQPFYYKDAYILCFENIGKIYPNYIKCCLDSPYLQNEIHKDSMATTVAQLTIMKAKELMIPFPPFEEQKRIVAKIEEILPYIEQYDNAYTKLETFNRKFPEDMKKSILQMAMQGKLVEQRKEEGTADELYEQIIAEKARLIKEGKIKKEKPLAEISEDEIPFEIPESWKWVRIGNIFVTSSGTTPSKSNPEFYSSFDYNWVRTTDLNNGMLDGCEIKISQKAFEECRLDIIPRDSVCIAMYGGAGTIGKNAIIKFDTTINQSVCAIHPNNFYDMLFLQRYIQYYRPNWMKMAVGSRKDPNINQVIIKNALIPLPPLDEQKRIVAKLEQMLPYCDQLIK